MTRSSKSAEQPHKRYLRRNHWPVSIVAGFVDLDGTLVDYESTEMAALTRLYLDFNLSTGRCSFEHYLETFVRANGRLWSKYHRSAITLDELRIARFEGLARVAQTTPVAMATRYEELLPACTRLFPDALPALDMLASARIELCLFTNGIALIQREKLRRLGLEAYFGERVLISEEQGVHKPSGEFLKIGLDQMNVAAAESIVIGDSYRSDGASALAVNVPFCQIRRGGLYLRHSSRVTRVRSSFTNLLDAVRAIVDHNDAIASLALDTSSSLSGGEERSRRTA